jgi:hypothetical protein
MCAVLPGEVFITRVSLGLPDWERHEASEFRYFLLYNTVNASANGLGNKNEVVHLCSNEGRWPDSNRGSGVLRS